MLPQIIMIVLQAITLGMAFQKDEADEGWYTLIALFLVNLLLWWGGWFSVFAGG